MGTDCRHPWVRVRVIGSSAKGSPPLPLTGAQGGEGEGIGPLFSLSSMGYALSKYFFLKLFFVFLMRRAA